MTSRFPFWFLLITMLIGHSSLAQWIESNNGINGGTITSLANSNGHIFAGTWGGIYHSANNGIAWKRMNDGLDNTFINALAVTPGGKVFAATKGGARMFVSTTPFVNWEIANIGLSGNPLIEMAVINDQVFAITSEGELFTLKDGSTSWIQIQTELGPINSISCSGENLFVASDNGIFLSTDRGMNWTPKNDGLLENPIYSISIVNRFLIAKARAGVTFFSDDFGSTWRLISLSGGRIKLIQHLGVLYAISEFDAYNSVDEGKKWENVRMLPGARDMIANGSTLIAGNPYGIYISTNNGSFSPGNFSQLNNARIVGFASSKDYVFTASVRGDVFRSSDIGKNWTSISKGLPFSEITEIGYFDNVLLIAKADYGIYRSEDQGGSWSFAAGLTKISSLVKHKDQLFAGSYYGVFSSSDKGKTWVKLNNSLQSLQSLHLFDKQDTLFATSPDYGVGYSVNMGQDWTSINNGLSLPMAQPTSVSSFNGLILVSAKSPAPIYFLGNISSAWVDGSAGIVNTTLINSFASDGRMVFAAGDQGVFSSYTGFDWSSFNNEQLPIFSSPKGVQKLHIHRNHLMAGTEAFGVWVSCIQPPRPVITVVGNAPNDSTLVSDSPEGNQWFLNGTLISGANQPTYKPAISGKYAVKVVLNDCESEMSEDVNLIVTEFPDAVITMPNAFTPNGDAYNPVFVPELYDNVSTAELRVVDRWGKVIFHTNELLAGWNGENVHAGVYYYLISYIGKNGKQGRIHGWVHLIR